jgi:hypothetical protein
LGRYKNVRKQMAVGLDINAIVELMERVGELRWGTIGK